MIARWYHAGIAIGRLLIRFLAGEGGRIFFFFSGFKIRKRFKSMLIY